MATARSTERITSASRVSLLTAQHYTIGVSLLGTEHQLGDAQQGGVPMSREEEIRAGLFDHTLNGHAPEVKALTEEGLSLGMDPMDILFKALIPSLEEVGRRFEKGDFFVPEMLIAAPALQGALVVRLRLIAKTGA